MDDPPPPYSEVDPATSSSRPPVGPITSYCSARPGSDDTSILAPHYNSQFVSAAPYFALRPPDRSLYSSITQHHLTIEPHSSPKDLRFPGQEFTKRGVDVLDWSTFLNHLFLSHNSTSNQLGRSSSSISAHARLDELSRLLAIIDEWNVGFFIPRGVQLMAEIKTPKPSIDPGIDAHPAGGETALYKAVNSGDTASVRLLLQMGANPNMKPWCGEPVLYLAVHKCLGGSDAHKEIINLLLKYGANVNAKPPAGVPPLFLVASRSNATLTSLLLRYGADPNAKPAGGAPALHIAADRSSLEVVSLLLQYGADINGKPPGGSTALFRACSRSDIPLVSLLLSAGGTLVDIDAAPPGSPTAFSYAIKRGDRAVFDLLISHRRPPSLAASNSSSASPVQLAAQRSNAYMLRALLACGAPVDAASYSYPATALVEAVKNSNHECVRILLEYGADPSTKRFGADAPLAVAARKGDKNILALLLGGRGGLRSGY
jgi:ankyrin repeat protein